MAVPHVNRSLLKAVSFNMHGFHQGFSVVDDLIKELNPDLFLLQEHWLTPSNLYYFDTNFVNYFSVGSSAMSKCVGQGMLRGRPFGGTIVLIKKELRRVTQTVHCDERYVIVKVANYLFVNVYLPCVGTTDRTVISDDILTDIWAWREHYSNCQLFIAGDFNVCLDNNSDVYSSNINDFLLRYSMSRCDDLFPQAKVGTYANAALNHQSQIDYAVTSSSEDVVNFEVLDPDLNFSDHLPLLATVVINYSFDNNRHLLPHSGSKRFTQRQLRWDYADRISYYNYTGVHLSPVLEKLNDLTGSNDFSSRP